MGSVISKFLGIIEPALIFMHIKDKAEVDLKANAVDFYCDRIPEIIFYSFVSNRNIEHEATKFYETSIEKNQTLLKGFLDGIETKEYGKWFRKEKGVKAADYDKVEEADAALESFISEREKLESTSVKEFAVFKLLKEKYSNPEQGFISTLFENIQRRSKLFEIKEAPGAAGAAPFDIFATLLKPLFDELIRYFKMNFDSKVVDLQTKMLAQKQKKIKESISAIYVRLMKIETSELVVSDVNTKKEFQHYINDLSVLAGIVSMASAVANQKRKTGSTNDYDSMSFTLKNFEEEAFTSLRNDVDKIKDLTTFKTALKAIKTPSKMHNNDFSSTPYHNFAQSLDKINKSLIRSVVESLTEHVFVGANEAKEEFLDFEKDFHEDLQPEDMNSIQKILTVYPLFGAFVEVSETENDLKTDILQEILSNDFDNTQILTTAISDKLNKLKTGESLRTFELTGANNPLIKKNLESFKFLSDKVFMLEDLEAYYLQKNAEKGDLTAYDEAGVVIKKLKIIIEAFNLKNIPAINKENQSFLSVLCFEIISNLALLSPNLKADKIIKPFGMALHTLKQKFSPKNKFDKNTFLSVLNVVDRYRLDKEKDETKKNAAHKHIFDMLKHFTEFHSEVENFYYELVQFINDKKDIEEAEIHAFEKIVSDLSTLNIIASLFLNSFFRNSSENKIEIPMFDNSLDLEVISKPTDENKIDLLESLQAKLKEKTEFKLIKLETMTLADAIEELSLSILSNGINRKTKTFGIYLSNKITKEAKILQKVQDSLLQDIKTALKRHEIITPSLKCADVVEGGTPTYTADEIQAKNSLLKPFNQYSNLFTGGLLYCQSHMNKILEDRANLEKNFEKFSLENLDEFIKVTDDEFNEAFKSIEFINTSSEQLMQENLKKAADIPDTFSINTVYLKTFALELDYYFDLYKNYFTTFEELLNNVLAEEIRIKEQVSKGGLSASEKTVLNTEIHEVEMNIDKTKYNATLLNNVILSVEKASVRFGKYASQAKVSADDQNYCLEKIKEIKELAVTKQDSIKTDVSGIVEALKSLVNKAELLGVVVTVETPKKTGEITLPTIPIYQDEQEDEPAQPEPLQVPGETAEQAKARLEAEKLRSQTPAPGQPLVPKTTPIAPGQPLVPKTTPIAPGQPLVPKTTPIAPGTTPIAPVPAQEPVLTQEPAAVPATDSTGLKNLLTIMCENIEAMIISKLEMVYPAGKIQFEKDISALFSKASSAVATNFKFLALALLLLSLILSFFLFQKNSMSGKSVRRSISAPEE